MTGYRHSDQSNGNKPPEGGKQRLKQPGSTRPEAEQEQPAAAPRRRSSSLLSNHWGKVALGTAAAVLVGGPLLVSHVQMNKEHPEFSPLSMQGMAQRVNRTWDHLGAMATAVQHRSDASLKRLSDSFSLSRGPALPGYAVVCYDKELLTRAAEGHPHARAYLEAAEIKLRPEISRLATKNAPFYKQHVPWDPDEPVPAAALSVDYDKFWYPEASVNLPATRPVSQWIAESGGGCPDSAHAEIRKLHFKPQ